MFKNFTRPIDQWTKRFTGDPTKLILLDSVLQEKWHHDYCIAVMNTTKGCLQKIKKVNFGTLAQKGGGGQSKIPNVDQYWIWDI